MVETLLEARAPWLSAQGPDSDVVLWSECSLVRNLADFPFPNQCTVRELESIEERVTAAFALLRGRDQGRFWPLHELTRGELRFLRERRLLPESISARKDRRGRGVYIADDQTLSITVNAANHLEITGLAAGLRTGEIWPRMSLLDDTLLGTLDFAFNDRLGFLTAAVGDLGTGLRCRLVLHTPGLVMDGAIPRIEEAVAAKRFRFTPLFGGKGAAVGDLFTLYNASTLGRSEEEILYHLKSLASGVILDEERKIRDRLRNEALLKLEDRTGRALGLARGARILEFPEALSVLSSLRLGVSEGLLEQFPLHALNEVLLAAQSAHLELKRGEPCDELALSAERAELFRTRFA